MSFQDDLNSYHDLQDRLANQQWILDRLTECRKNGSTARTLQKTEFLNRILDRIPGFWDEGGLKAIKTEYAQQILSVEHQEELIKEEDSIATRVAYERECFILAELKECLTLQSKTRTLEKVKNMKEILDRIQLHSRYEHPLNVIESEFQKQKGYVCRIEEGYEKKRRYIEDTARSRAAL